LLLSFGKKGNTHMTASSNDKKLNMVFWRVDFVLTGAYTLFWLYPALTDWLRRALSGRYGSFPDLGPYGLVDTVALLLLKHSMWLLLAMVGLNVLATITCFLAVRGRSFAFPLRIYVGGFVLVGMAATFCDIRLYQIGIGDGEDAFVMTMMWCILAVPLWILVAKGVWTAVTKQFASKTWEATA